MTDNLIQSSKLERYPPISPMINGLKESTKNALKEAVLVNEISSQNNYLLQLPPLIRTTRREIPKSFDIISFKLEFNYLGLPKMNNNGEYLSREEWIDNLKYFTPKNIYYIWSLLNLEECVKDNGVFDMEKVNANIESFKLKNSINSKFIIK